MSEPNSAAGRAGPVPIRLIYRRPYEDAWGVLHDPTTEWDELLKYYQHGLRLLVSEATRKKARPASAGARELIRQERQAERLARLEARDLELLGRRKQWKRRKSRRYKGRAARKR